MTRKQLIDYIESFHPSQWPHPEEIADALIKEGFVKVHEPREFWIDIDLLTKECKVIDGMYLQLENHEIIHVREVVE